jgi:hypothetical protein
VGVNLNGRSIVERMADTGNGRTPVHIEPGGDMWGRLRRWLHESQEAIDAGDVSRLPESLAGDGGRNAREAYETVLMAMEILETGHLGAGASDSGSRT